MRTVDDMKRFFSENNNMVRRLIVINAIVFLAVCLVRVGLYFISGQANNVLFNDFVRLFSLPASPEEFMTRPWSLITYMFFHYDLMDILFNMLWMFWIGSIFTEFLGNMKTLATYVWGGVFGAVLYFLAYNFIPGLPPAEEGNYLLGASAGVLALVVGAAAYIPYYEKQIPLFGYVKLSWIALIIVAIDLVSIAGQAPGGHIAHLGGALFGFIYARQLRARALFSETVDSFNGFIGSIFNKKQPSTTVTVKKEQPLYSGTYISDFEDDHEPNQEEVDAILDKINQSGYESLTRREKDLLFKASKQD